MTDLNRLARIYSEVALMNMSTARVASMQAANEGRTRRGEALAYNEEAFEGIAQDFHANHYNLGMIAREG